MSRLGSPEAEAEAEAEERKTNLCVSTKKKRLNMTDHDTTCQAFVVTPPNNDAPDGDFIPCNQSATWAVINCKTTRGLFACDHCVTVLILSSEDYVAAKLDIPLVYRKYHP